MPQLEFQTEISGTVTLTQNQSGLFCVSPGYSQVTLPTAGIFTFTCTNEESTCVINSSIPIVGGGVSSTYQITMSGYSILTLIAISGSWFVMQGYANVSS